MHRKLFRTLCFLSLSLLALSLLATTSIAQVPRTISYQGQALLNGQALDGSHTVTIAFYTTPTGGSPLYVEVQPNITFDAGVFNVLIGASQSIPQIITFDRPYYLGIRIDDGTELVPRTSVAAAPYSMYADKAGEAQSLSPSVTGVVTSINNQNGALTFEGAGATTVTSSGNTITISSSGGSGATGIQGVQSVNASIAITDPNGPVANLSLNENAVKTPNLFDAAVTTSKLANESVSTAKLADASVSSAKILDDAIATIDVADAAITSSKLADSAVTADKLATDAVTSDKIATDAVTSSEIATSAVTTNEILDATVATEDLAPSSVTTAKIASTGATNGQLLTANGSGGTAWLNAPTLSLPFAATTATGNPAFDIQTTGATGGAGRFRVTNAANASPVLNLTSTGTGAGLTVQLSNAASGARGIDVTHSGVGPGVFASSAGGNAVWGITSSISSAGVIGDNTFGEAIVGRNRGGNGVGAVVGRNDSSGYGVRGFNTKAGIGVLGQAGISGGTGVGGRFENVNASNTNDALQAVTNGSGHGLLVTRGGNATATFAAVHVENHQSTGEGMWLRNANSSSSVAAIKMHVHPSSSSPLLLGATWTGSGNATNVFRVDKAGKGFFNGGTQNSGADIAESFAVVGDVSTYEPGDVLVIASGEIRTVTKSSTPYSTAVLGVHATKPGVLLTEVELDGDMSDLVPMGVMGVIPTKVTNEGGAIRAGDLLVTSPTAGHAMRADLRRLSFGMVLGKALEDFSGTTGVIQVFVNVR